MIVTGAIILLIISVLLGYWLTGKIAFSQSKSTVSVNDLAFKFLKEESIEKLEELRAVTDSKIAITNQDLSNLNLQRSVLNGLSFKEVKFINTDLSFADLRNTNFEQCDFSKANIKNAQWNNSKLVENNFKNANVSKTDFSNSFLTKNIFTETVQKEINLNSSKFEENIDLLITEENPNEFENSNNYRSIDELIRNIASNPVLMFELNPNRLEEIVGTLLESFNYRVDFPSPNSRDGGYDLLITKDDLIDQRIIVEVKRTSPARKVGLSSVKALYASLLNLNYDRALLVTTSHLTSEAMKFAKETNGKIKVVDYSEFLLWIKNYDKNTPYNNM